MKDVDLFLRQLQEGTVSTVSIDDLRNEDLQKKAFGRRIPMLKKERNKNSRVLFFKSLAIPFSPITGQVTADHNDGRKFRTEKSVSLMILSFKKHYDQNPEVKEIFMRKAKIDSWDTSNHETITAQDRAAFAEFTVDQVFSVNHVHINNKAVTGRPDGADYKLDVKRDLVTGKIIKEWKAADGTVVKMSRFTERAIALGEFFSACKLQEYKDWEATEGADKTDDAKFKKKISFLSESPIGEDRPRNFILGMKLPLTETLELDLATIKKMEIKDFARCIVLVPYSNTLKTKLGTFHTTYKSRDVYADFYELDMIVPDVEDAKERGQGTSFNPAESKIADSEVKDFILDSISSALDEFENLDKIVLGSTYIEPLNGDVIEALVRNLSTTLDIKTLRITEGIVSRFADLISTIFGEKASDILVGAEFGELDKGTVTEADSKLTRSQIMDALNDDDDLEEIDVDIEE